MKLSPVAALGLAVAMRGQCVDGSPVRLLATVVGAILAAALLAGCDSPREQRERELTEMLDALTPRGVERPRLGFGGCVALQSDPDCASMNLVWPEDALQQRKPTLEAMALEAGWEKTDEVVRPGGTTMGFERRGYLLAIRVPTPELLAMCPSLAEVPETQTSACLDGIRIHVVE